MSSGKAKRRINWAIPGLLAMILVIVAIATIQSLAATAPEPDKLADQCGSCHVMDTYVATWHESSHKEIACYACHADTGVKGWAKMQWGRVQMWMTARDGHVDLARVATEVPNERCIACHAREMPWVMQDLEPPELDEAGEPLRVARSELEFLPAQAGHDLHLTMEEPLQCTDCHGGVSHGPAEPPRAVEAMHNTCLECHAEEQVAMEVQTTISCSACHVDLTRITPDDHRSQDFRKSHGLSAREDVGNCARCHLNPGIGQVALGPHGMQTALLSDPDQASTTPASDEKQPFADWMIPEMPPGSLAVPEDLAQKDACAACHGTTMPHPEGWLSRHAQGFDEKPELCASCHGTREQGFNMTYTGNPRTLSTDDPSCTGCHAQPMPHPEEWPRVHDEFARIAPATCEQCHSDQNPANPEAAHASPRYCLDCHLSRYRHPDDFVSTHMEVVAVAGGQEAAGCTQCHKPTENSCTSCHAGGIGSTQWHPEAWTANHGPLMTAAGGPSVVSCTNCHTETLNSCTQCHTNGVGQEQQWHPEEWVATHLFAVRDAGSQEAAGCTECHTETVNSCAQCHTGGVEGEQQWHEDFWWVKHAQLTYPDDFGDCATCHDYVEPSCSKCHSRF